MTPEQDTLRERILTALRCNCSLRWEEIAEAVGEPDRRVLAQLHIMDDLGDVMMKNGRYWLSEKTRQAVARVDVQEIAEDTLDAAAALVEFRGKGGKTLDELRAALQKDTTT